MWIPIIGLEIHVRLKTQSKMFCSCPNVPEDTLPNTAICPVCTGQPGALPAVNDEAIRLGVRAGLAIGCTIPDQAHFDRKNYFYPDLPKGYQISQFDFPIALNGALTLEVPGNKPPRDTVRIGITRAHLEEDAAKNIHHGKTNKTLVDFNRASTPLLEIVTEPDLRSPAEAKFFLQELQAILRAVNASDADMEKGYMRCDANISLLEIDDKTHLPKHTGLNPKAEIKNLNSFRAVERALQFEIERQQKIYNEKGRVAAETRGWDEHKNETVEQRSKETSADYRYFPEPDLPPLDLSKVREAEKKHLPMLPNERRERLMEEWGFTKEDAKTLVASEGLADFAEEVMGELGTWMEATDKKQKPAGNILKANKTRLAKLVGGWLTSKYLGCLAQRKSTHKDSQVSAENFAELLHLIDTNVVNSTNAQKLLVLMIETNGDPSHLLEEHNLGQSEDPKLVEETVARLIEQNPDQVKQIREGKLTVVKWFVGSVMKATEGKANPTKAEEEVKKQLGL